MSCRGVHFALTEEQQDKILELTGNDDALIEYIQEDIEEAWDRDWLCETDKAWDAIHRCLTDGQLTFEPTSPLHMAVLGGRHLYQGDDYIVTFVPQSDIAVVSSNLEDILQAGLRQKYFALNEDDYGMPLSEEDWEYTWENFQDMRAFYAKASTANRSVIFTTDQ